eukprot:3361480-Pleurochrysis_carterae.AAC.1
MPSEVILNAARCVSTPSTTSNSSQLIGRCTKVVPERAAVSLAESLAECSHAYTLHLLLNPIDVLSLQFKGYDTALSADDDFQLSMDSICALLSHSLGETCVLKIP